MTDTPAIGISIPYTVQTYDIDHHRKMKVAALVRQMQEAAMQNVMELKVSVWDMEEQHFSWVLLRKKLQVKRLPMIGEKLTFVTYPSGFERVFTYRDFFVFDEKGEPIATSATTWLLLQTQTRRMVRTPEIPEFVLAYESQIPPAEDCLPRAEVNLPELKKIDTALSFRTGFHDLDFNGHLNNAFYIQWMLETLPDQILVEGKLQDLQIQYKVEAHWKDEIESELQKLSGGEFLHSLKRKSDGKEIAIALTKWG